MNKILTFSPASVTSLEVHLAWASLEILADDVDELQIMAAGDDNDVNDLKVEEKAAATCQHGRTKAPAFPAIRMRK